MIQKQSNAGAFQYNKKSYKFYPRTKSIQNSEGRLVKIFSLKVLYSKKSKYKNEFLVKTNKFLNWIQKITEDYDHKWVEHANSFAQLKVLKKEMINPSICYQGVAQEMIFS